MKWGLTRAEHWILIALITIVTMGVGANYYQNERQQSTLEIDLIEPPAIPLGADPDKIDLNKATAAELQALPRVGPALAQRIIDYRTQNGPFKTIEDLKKVSGIGDKTFEDMKNLITAGADISTIKSTGPVQPPEFVRPSNIERSPAPAATPVPPPQAAGAQTPAIIPGLIQPATSAATAAAAAQPASNKININTASATELQKLPRIGPAISQRIIEYRTANGPFKTIEAIQNVRGIGPATFEGMKDMITVDAAPASPSTPAAQPARPGLPSAAAPAVPSSAPSAAPVGNRININTATQQQLVMLPGIGEAYAQRIMEYRTQNGPFKSVEELANVRGIGPKTMENIRPLVTVE